MPGDGKSADDGDNPAIDDHIDLYMPHPPVEALPLFPHGTIRCSEGDYYAMFKQLDLDRVGAFRIRGGDMNEAEIGHVLHKFGLRKAQQAKFFDICREDEDGCITFAEFMVVMKECNKELPIRFFERIFLMFEDPTSCILARLISYFTTGLIFMSTVAFVVESLPILRSQPQPCDGIEVSCKPAMSDEVQATFMGMEAFCVAGFTIDYVARLLCCPFTRGYVIGHAGRGDNTPVFHFSADVYGDRKKEALRRHPVDNLVCTRLLYFVIQPMNIIDFVAIFPFYLELVLPSDGGDGGLMVLRLLRLGRVLRLLKLGKRNAGMIIFANAFMTASSVLGVLMFMIMLITILFGTLLHLTEGGEWHEPSDSCEGFPCSDLYPQGAFLRLDVLGNSLQESPYKSIVHSCWAVMTTITTVGYGDLYPTSPWGKAIASVSMIVGLLVVALPITVLGGAFAHEVQRHGAHLDQTQQKEKFYYKQYLRDQLERCHPGSMRQQQLDRKLQMILRYEKEVHIAQHDDSSVPGGGENDFVLLTLARIHKELTTSISEVHEKVASMEARLATGGSSREPTPAAGGKSLSAAMGLKGALSPTKGPSGGKPKRKSKGKGGKGSKALTPKAQAARAAPWQKIVM